MKIVIATIIVILISSNTAWGADAFGKVAEGGMSFSITADEYGYTTIDMAGFTETKTKDCYYKNNRETQVLCIDGAVMGEWRPSRMAQDFIDGKCGLNSFACRIADALKRNRKKCLEDPRKQSGVCSRYVSDSDYYLDQFRYWPPQERALDTIQMACRDSRDYLSTWCLKYNEIRPLFSGCNGMDNESYPPVCTRYKEKTDELVGRLNSYFREVIVDLERKCIDTDPDLDPDIDERLRRVNNRLCSEKDNLLIDYRICLTGTPLDCRNYNTRASGLKFKYQHFPPDTELEQQLINVCEALNPRTTDHSYIEYNGCRKVLSDAGVYLLQCRDPDQDVGEGCGGYKREVDYGIARYSL